MSGDLSNRSPAGHLGDSERLLDEMFRAQHGWLTLKTMSSPGLEVYGGRSPSRLSGPARGQTLLQEAVDQFDHLS